MASGLLRDLGLGVVALVVLLAIPGLVGSAGLIDFMIYVAAYGLLAMSLNLLTGYTGLVSFGHAAYFASGAYSFGLLMQSGTVSIPAAFAIAVGFSALTALVVGAICVRLKEIYFAFLTLAFQMMFHSIILTWVSLTGGDQGLMGGIPRPAFWGIDLSSPGAFYTFCMIVFVICILILRQIVQSPFGYTLRMIRDNPGRAEFLGVNIYRAKLVSFVLAGSIASVGGILLALFASGAYPEFAYWTMSGQAIFMIMLGGSRVFLGPLLGAVLLQGLNHYVTAVTEHHGLVLGIVIVVAVLGLRRGLADFALDWREARRERRLAADRDAGREPSGNPAASGGNA
ncbi:branched-chain amino acid ABC transporter permease [Albimonas pacifica]|uniref:Amino acid/amide ABC transporter membrane protein 2, HAAT family n=1 Tax=Albimonas pacifica TaxID=1114924 RepID=A0A1I3L073_9RHOB|nr:branched-chain amino acid ABC transporter permease [Albimonas pacifica]SFI77998.1 amino acid/amide ABC transporter membrane protein 2, HAAT family [Albimonas pacifica]